MEHIIINGDNNYTGHYYFRIESWGQLSPKEIFEAAIDQFDNLLDDFVKQLNG